MTIKKQFRRALLFITAIIAAITATAQDSAIVFKFSGSVDAYYRANFDNPTGSSGGNNYTNNYTAFTNSQNTFELGMASLRVDASTMSGRLLGTIDLGFGRRAEEFSYSDGHGWIQGVSLINQEGPAVGNSFNTLSAVKQAYLSFYPGKDSTGIKFSIGKWEANFGYERLDAYQNKNYSMSYLFSYGPLSYTGLKAEYQKNTWKWMLGLTNPPDATAGETSGKTLIASISNRTKNNKIKIELNYQYVFSTGQGIGNNNILDNGLNNLNQIGLVGRILLNSKWSLGEDFSTQIRTGIFNALYYSKTSWGNAVYINYDPLAALGITLRNEYVSDPNENSFQTLYVFDGVAASHIYDATLSLNYRIGTRFTLIPEFRYEDAGNLIFVKHDGSPTKSTFTGLIAFILSLK